MPYVIYHKETTILTHLKRGYSDQSYKTERAAKAALTRGARSGKITNSGEFAIAEIRDFLENIEKTKVVKNLMTGKEIEIAVNTPRCRDPSSELYWSM